MRDTAERLGALRAALDDVQQGRLRAATSDLVRGDEFAVEVELTDDRGLSLDIGDARAWLDAHVNLESIGAPARRRPAATAPTLERIRALVELLGSPQREYPDDPPDRHERQDVGDADDVGAPRGVGSLGRHVHEPAPRAGQRAHRLERRADRRRRRWLELLPVIADVEAHLSERPSYFEILTAAALTWFADVAVDVAVVEVGVGGTWDATNVVDGRVAVVTNVSVDHVEYLGPTREEIATEKAGIVKPGATLVLGETDPELVPRFLDARRRTVVVTRDATSG